MSSLASAIDAYLRALDLERGRSPHTIRAVGGDLHRFADYAAEQGATVVDDLNLELFRDWLWHESEQGHAASTLARRSSSARGFTAWLRTSGRGEDVARRLRSPKTGRSLPRMVSTDNMDAIFDELRARSATGDPVALRD